MADKNITWKIQMMAQKDITWKIQMMKDITCKIQMMLLKRETKEKKKTEAKE
jgi:hypothetical protein